jgi:hypothetical protein
MEPAVYQARNLIDMINDTMDYNDDAICLQSGIYRIGTKDSTEKPLPEISIIPNPANEQVEVRINGKLDGLCLITITNMLGQKAMIDEMACLQHNKKIDVRSLGVGVYTVKVQNNNMSKTAKLVISR